MTTSVELPCVGAEEGARGDFTYFVCVRACGGFTHFRATTACGSPCRPVTHVNFAGAYLTAGIRLHLTAGRLVLDLQEHFYDHSFFLFIEKQ